MNNPLEMLTCDFYGGEKSKTPLDAGLERADQNSDMILLSISN